MTDYDNYENGHASGHGNGHENGHEDSLEHMLDESRLNTRRYQKRITELEQMLAGADFAAKMLAEQRDELIKANYLLKEALEAVMRERDVEQNQIKELELNLRAADSGYKSLHRINKAMLFNPPAVLKQTWTGDGFTTEYDPVFGLISDDDLVDVKSDMLPRNRPLAAGCGLAKTFDLLCALVDIGINLDNPLYSHTISVFRVYPENNEVSIDVDDKIVVVELPVARTAWKVYIWEQYNHQQFREWSAKQ